MCHDISLVGPPAKTECFASHFADIFNTHFHSPDAFSKNVFIDSKIFQQHVLDMPFSMTELLWVLGIVPSKKAAGHDGIPYELLQCLLSPYLSHLLANGIYNSSCCTHTLPSYWKDFIVLPFLKSGKPPSDPASYRPIFLFVTICIVIEKLVHLCLYYYLESRLAITFSIWLS